LRNPLLDGGSESLDEPVSALDVSIQAGVLNVLQRLKSDLGLAYLFVSHDLSVIRHIADRVSVLYLGRTIEAGAIDEVFNRARHPDTQALLSAVPIPDPVREQNRERGTCGALLVARQVAYLSYGKSRRTVWARRGRRFSGAHADRY
jgi:ABC-type dipeptide/oligopeptide/nickel transport system ATPase component